MERDTEAASVGPSALHGIAHRGRAVGPGTGYSPRAAVALATRSRGPGGDSAGSRAASAGGQRAQRGRSVVKSRAVGRNMVEDNIRGHLALSASTASPTKREDQWSEGELSDSKFDVPEVAAGQSVLQHGSGVTAGRPVSLGQPGKSSSILCQCFFRGCGWG